jgi:TonB family protein
MSDKREPLSIYSSQEDRVRDSADPSEEQGLKALFRLWNVPRTPARLDWRIIESYRQQILQGDRQEVFMKQCPTCQEEFANKFSFCPVDGTPLDELTAAAAAPHEPAPDIPPAYVGATAAAAGSMALVPVGEYHLTFVDDTGLTRRLTTELKQVAHNSELTWPEFKRDPFGYSKRFITGYGTLIGRFFSQRNVAIATSSALLVVLTAAIGFVVYGRYLEGRARLAQKENDLEVEQIISPDEIPDDIKETKPDKGIGTGEQGRVGFGKGRGEGSKPKFEKAGGGGGGGQQEALPTQQGRIPPPSVIPALIPTTPPARPPMLPVAGIDIDPALYKNLPYDRFGDPRSKSTDKSAGPGTGNGLGNGTGAGIGEGDGQGFGPGHGRNMGGGDPNDGGGGVGGGNGNNGTDYSRTFTTREVNVKARILSRPEPQYTEEARKNQVSGTVVLRAVFSSSGQVTNIRAVSGLPYGLTERAIAAARQIRFTPAMKDGRPVSQYIQIEYNFNLY